jgi:hypothetical protein
MSHPIAGRIRRIACALVVALAAAQPAAGYQNPIGAGTHGKSPTVLVANNTYYLFSSYTGDAQLAGNVPLQSSTDLQTWTYQGDALPNLPAWVDPTDPEVSAPAALSRPSLGRYLLYFGARHRNDGSGLSGRRCIGVVAAATPTLLLGGGASLIPSSTPLVCAADRDALDPAIYTAAAPSGDPYAWLLWVERRAGQPDAIVHTLLTSDGAGMVVVPALTILTAETSTNSWEQGRFANPAIVYDANSDIHFLFYSGNDAVYSVDNPTVTVTLFQPNPPKPARYGSNWATCAPTVFGVFTTCVRGQRGPWLRSQDAARPGDADFFRDAGGALWMAYDASAVTQQGWNTTYQAPRLFLDKVCIGTENQPRTNGPTTAAQSVTRQANCGLDVQLIAEAWPEADALFQQDPRWRGGDGAWSFDLGEERTLWMFGDSFIDPEGETRIGSTFIRNSIAIQQGADPTTADMTFYWKTTAGGAPTAFFKNPAYPNLLYWGGAGSVVGPKLILFQHGFLQLAGGVEYQHTLAVVIDNYEADPSQWQMTWHTVGADPGNFPWVTHHAFVVGSFLYVYVGRPGEATNEAFDSAALLRFPNQQARAGNFSNPRWWTGSSWSLDGPIETLWSTTTQYSVHDIGNGEHYAIMGGLWFGPALFATAPARTGPFSAFTPFYTTPEAYWGGSPVLTYFWHAHPQLTGAPIVTTYSTNGNEVVSDETIYYPKFVRFTPP